MLENGYMINDTEKDNKTEYPECKRYPELFERMQHNKSAFDPPHRFYVTDYGLITYNASIFWLVRKTDGTWKPDYILRDRVTDCTYDVVWIDPEVVDEYGFTKPVEGVDY